MPTPPTVPSPLAAAEEVNVLPPDAHTRGLSVATLVLGLLVMIPFATQGLALVLGCVAVLRRRQPGERVLIAWVGIILAIAALVGWIMLTATILIAAPGPGMGPAFTGASSWAGPGGLLDTFALVERGKRVQTATHGFQRDFQQWPGSLADLTGLYLPAEFRWPDALTYLPPPNDREPGPNWIIVHSKQVAHDLDGEVVSGPAVLVVPLDGEPEVVSPEELARRLALQRDGAVP
jgi:hypothetical protein